MFNVGDKVRVRADLKVGRYKVNSVVHEMLVYAGLDAIITKVIHLGGHIQFTLDIDNGKWRWDSGMLIPVKEVNSYNEEESVRLAKAVCEYEEIVHNLEQDLQKVIHERDEYKTMYQEMRDMYNKLIDEYNGLVDDYNNVITEYVFKE